MAFFDIAQLSADLDFQARISACYATETFGQLDRLDPPTWTTRNIWEIAAAPGFGDAYASAIAGGVENPGRDPAVISDSQILSAVQAVLNAGG